ncbi:MAG TPA: hypothetical protein ENJ91_07980 [Rhodobacteraceae bacterium]|nr:hypothetical protein [Paracoccaceae bacterium]
MALWQSILLGIAALIAIAVLIEMILKRNQPRPPLAKQFLGDDVGSDQDEEKPELGMEAVDWDVIRESERASKSSAALGARDMQFWSKYMHRRPKSRKTDTPQQRKNGEEK